jgi:hypothetical protein
MVGWEGLMTAVIAQAMVDLADDSGDSSKRLEAEAFLSSSECCWMVEYLGWDCRWPWRPVETSRNKLNA